MTGLSEGYANWVDEATDYSSMAADGMKQAMGGAVTTITDMLNGNVDSWKDWGVSVLKIIQNVLVNMAVANGVSSIGSLFSLAHLPPLPPVAVPLFRMLARTSPLMPKVMFTTLHP
jgi:lambda family phage tail tape measure protein